MKQVTKLALVGCPNVGKSVLFNYLTGAYVTVSNYPGTTIDIARGRYRYQGRSFEVFDTPGVYSLAPFTEEERVTRRFLEQEAIDLVIHVVDAKNLARMLPMTLQLLEAELPVVLVINLIDEGQAQGIYVQEKKLAEFIGVPVVLTSATRGLGLDLLKRCIAAYQYAKPKPFRYSPPVEESIAELSSALSGSRRFATRAVALLLLQGDPYTLDAVGRQPYAEKLFQVLYRSLDRIGDNAEMTIYTERQQMVNTLLGLAVRIRPHRVKTVAEQVSQATREPLTGIPILLIILYLGLYLFVGRLGAGILVDYLDKTIFARYISPIVENAVLTVLPWEWAQSLLIGEYGMYSLGIRYAVVIVLPIVGTFFLMFALLEDCGYLPRLAMLVDQLLRRFGLNGRAAIPLTLGFGCGTMAVMVTRTLETRRERLIATLLLSLAIPCSAQLGVVLALLSQSAYLLVIWAVCMAVAFLSAGLLAARLLPGKRSPFYMELPPLRLPLVSNIIKKAYSRMLMYFCEILPVFVMTSLLLWAIDRIGLLTQIITGLAPLMQILGLPPETADVFLLGFFRRDYGAAGLYDMARQGLLGSRELLVACTTLSLFVPCIAQLMVMIKERGIFASFTIVALIMAIAFSAGALLNRLLALM